MADIPEAQIWDMLEELSGTDWRSKPATVETTFGTVEVRYQVEDGDAFAVVTLPLPRMWFGMLENGVWGSLDGLAYRIDGLSADEIEDWAGVGFGTEEDEEEE
jgi:hypothetical protein